MNRLSAWWVGGPDLEVFRSPLLYLHRQRKGPQQDSLRLRDCQLTIRLSEACNVANYVPSSSLPSFLTTKTRTDQPPRKQYTIISTHTLRWKSDVELSFLLDVIVRNIRRRWVVPLELHRRHRRWPDTRNPLQHPLQHPIHHPTV